MIDIRDYITTAEPIARLDELEESEWLKLRREGVGGSDAGAILGLSKYNSPLSLWMEKTGRVIPDALDNEAINFGNDMEPLIRHELFPKYLHKNYDVAAVIRDPDFMWRAENGIQQANVDGWVYLETPLNGFEGLGGLEIKTGSSYVLKDWGGRDGDEVPDTYYAQVQHYMDVFAIPWFIVFGVIGNSRLIRFVPRNDEFISDLRQSELEFWETVKANDPLTAPAPMGLDADMDALLELGNPQSEEVASVEGELMRRYEQARELEKDAKATKEYYKQQIIAQMGDAKWGEADGYKSTFSRFMRSSFDTKGFKADNPQLAEKYTRYNETGRLSVKSI